MNRARAVSVGRGFSLIEVLIGILILALGLLGLGAIIPVVVREQRAGADLTLGQACLKDAEHYILTRPDLDPTDGSANTAWDVLLAATGSGGWSSGNNACLWQPWGTTSGPALIDPTTGTLSFTDSSGGIAAVIRVADRLWPPLSRQGAATIPLGQDPNRPQFVWDFVGRRLPTEAGEPEKLQLAIFVRRIDLNIRVARGIYPGSNPPRSITLYDVLTQRTNIGTPQYPYRVPVGAYPPVPTTPNPGQGAGSSYLPTNMGIVPPGSSSADLNYSVPIVLRAEYDPAEPDRIEFPTISSPATSTLFKLISQPGQKLVDNLGNIYTVIAEPEEATTHSEVHIEPRIPAWVPDPASPDPANLPAGAPNPAKIHQVVFVPQIPAAIRVITLTRPVP
jgi:prepilin-type N-terminal cleavage/methylation domain-containing protein